MRHQLYLAAASFVIAASAPSAIYAQPSGTPNPASIPDPGSASGQMTPAQGTTPSISPTPPTGGAPRGSASTGMCSAMSSGASTMTPSPSASSSGSASSTASANAAMPAAAKSGESVARLLQVNSDQVEYNNLIGPAHYIKLSVGSSPLCYLSLEPLQDVSATDSIKVLDQSGNIVNAVVTKQDTGGAKVAFEQPVAAGSTLTLALQGVEYFSSLTPATVQYSVSGGFADYSQEIPYGIAQVQRFLR